MRDFLLALGINTGNSLDGADSVVTRFGLDGSIVDIKSHSDVYPAELAESFRAFRSVLKASDGVPEAAISAFDRARGIGAFDALQSRYMTFIAESVGSLLSRIENEKPDVIGFHGQTCAHLPPSVAKTNDSSKVYTFQLGNGQALADATGITVVYDFRSDDLMNGGEGAPLAPRHHEHLAHYARARGQFPLAFINGGNTANFSFISVDEGGQTATLGWDAGPFNDFPDQLVRVEKGEACDFDGKYGRQGRPNEELLRVLFDSSAVTREGENFLLRLPPKSSDPQWYKMPPELLGEKPVGGKVLSFEERLRTAEYFGAYVCFFALSQLPKNIAMTPNFALCGGGWKNPVTREHFSRLVQGQWEHEPILSEHRTVFEKTVLRLKATGAALAVEPSQHFGFDGNAMEARLFADAAVARIRGEPFTTPETTGTRMPTVCGALRFPHLRRENATPTLLAWLDHFHSEHSALDVPGAFDPRWSRAAAGWAQRLARRAL